MGPEAVSCTSLDGKFIQHLTGDAQWDRLAFIARVGLGQDDGITVSQVCRQHGPGPLAVGFFVDDA